MQLQSLYTEGFCSTRVHAQSKILVLHSHILCCPWFYALFVRSWLNACKNVKLGVFIMVYIFCLLGINNRKVIRVLALLTLRL